MRSKGVVWAKPRKKCPKCGKSVIFVSAASGLVGPNEGPQGYWECGEHAGWVWPRECVDGKG